MRSNIAASSSGETSSRWRFSMIATSSAVSSSNSTDDGRDRVSAAMRDARQRRSPAMSW